MLKIRIWDREAMHKSDYDGPVEYLAKQCFIDQNGFFRFAEPNGITHSYNPDEYMIDILEDAKGGKTMEIIIKMDHDEPVKTKLSSIYEEMPQFPDMDKIRDKFWTENYIGKLKEKIDRLKMDLQNRDDEIQDLKLENDRLKRREEIMLHFIRSVACVFSCGECDIKDDQKRCHYLKFSDSISTGSRMKKSATKILNELEDL